MVLDGWRAETVDVTLSRFRVKSFPA